MARKLHINRVLYGLFHITSHINLRRPYQPENFSLRAWYWSTVDMGCDMKKSISYCVYHIFQECTEVWYKFSGVSYKLQECDMSHDDKDKNKQRYDTSFRGVVRAVKLWQVIQAMHFTSDLASAHHFRQTIKKYYRWLNSLSRWDQRLCNKNKNSIIRWLACNM
jgi:hypothetical protein